MHPQLENTTWYISRNGQQFGPISTGELQDRYKRGELHATDHLWCPEINSWILVSQIFATAPPMTPPPSPTSQYDTRETFPPPSHAHSHISNRHAPTTATEDKTKTVKTTTVISDGNFKFSTLIFILLGIFIPLWPISLPLFWFLAYRSYKKPSIQTVRIIES